MAFLIHKAYSNTTPSYCQVFTQIKFFSEEIGTAKAIEGENIETLSFESAKVFRFFHFRERQLPHWPTVYDDPLKILSWLRLYITIFSNKFYTEKTFRLRMSISSENEKAENRYEGVGWSWGI